MGIVSLHSAGPFICVHNGSSQSVYAKGHIYAPLKLHSTAHESEHFLRLLEHSYHFGDDSEADFFD